MLSRKILINEISERVCFALPAHATTVIIFRPVAIREPWLWPKNWGNLNAACGNSKVRGFARSRNYLGWKFSIRRIFCPRMDEIRGLRNWNPATIRPSVGQWVIVSGELVFTARSFRNPKDIVSRNDGRCSSGCTPNVWNFSPGPRKMWKWIEWNFLDRLVDRSRGWLEA